MHTSIALSSTVFQRPSAGQGLPRSTRRRAPPCRATGKGFGVGMGDSESQRGKLQDAIKESRDMQLSTSDMLAKLLQAPDPRQVAQQHVESLTEEFFWTANTYLSMAQKEGNTTVTQHIESALKAALEAKQATLRVEIQLLNRLLGAETQEARQRLLFGPDAFDTLTMNNRYFFGMLERMQADVGTQPDSPQKAALVQRLASIHQDATAAEAAGGL